MIAVLPPRSTRVRNNLEDAFERAFRLSVHQRKTLAKAIRGGKVLFSTEAVRIGTPAPSPDAVKTLKEGLLDNNDSKRTKAELKFAEVALLIEARQRAFRRWLMNGTVPEPWIGPLVAALRHDVTYVHFMVTDRDPIGVFYFERG